MTYIIVKTNIAIVNADKRAGYLNILADFSWKKNDNNKRAAMITLNTIRVFIFCISLAAGIFYQPPITETDLKIGKYIATTINPTLPPSNTIIRGSINCVRLPTAVSTSSS